MFGTTGGEDEKHQIRSLPVFSFPCIKARHTLYWNIFVSPNFCDLDGRTKALIFAVINFGGWQSP